jgi:hypothetical protein
LARHANIREVRAKIPKECPGVLIGSPLHCVGSNAIAASASDEQNAEKDANDRQNDQELNQCVSTLHAFLPYSGYISIFVAITVHRL